MTIAKTELSVLSRLFSSTVVRDLAERGKSAAFARLVKQSQLLTPRRNSRVRHVFDKAFDILKKNGLRDEYIYKAALTHRVLMGKHSLRTASMLNEFRVRDCVADVAILNGTTTVFEIKSERDSLSRLEKQIASYREVFSSVFVIAGENHVDAIIDAMPTDVGVVSLDNRYYISTRREAKDRPNRILPETVFESIRTTEAVEILKYLGLQVPEVPNTLLRSKMRPLFQKMKPTDCHRAMLRTLKQTRDLQPLAALVDKLPASLQAAALSVRLRKADHDRLVEAVNAPLERALSWT